jgi:hypothetical protein
MLAHVAALFASELAFPQLPPRVARNIGALRGADPARVSRLVAGMAAGLGSELAAYVLSRAPQALALDWPAAEARAAALGPALGAPAAAAPLLLRKAPMLLLVEEPEVAARLAAMPEALGLSPAEVRPAGAAEAWGRAAARRARGAVLLLKAAWNPTLPHPLIHPFPLIPRAGALARAQVARRAVPHAGLARFHGRPPARARGGARAVGGGRRRHQPLAHGLLPSGLWDHGALLTAAAVVV